MMPLTGRLLGLLAAAFCRGVAGQTPTWIQQGTATAPFPVSTGKTVVQLGMQESSFTAMAWIYREDSNTDQEDHTIFGSYRREGEEKQDRDTLHLVVRRSRFYMGFWSNDCESQSVSTIGEWEHVAWSYDADSKNMRIFMDGKMVGRCRGEPLLGTREVIVGDWGASPDKVPGRRFAGTIAGGRIFGELLDVEQIRQVMQRSDVRSTSTTLTSTTTTRTDTVLELGFRGLDKGLADLRQELADAKKDIEAAKGYEARIAQLEGTVQQLQGGNAALNRSNAELTARLRRALAAPVAPSGPDFEPADPASPAVLPPAVEAVGSSIRMTVAPGMHVAVNDDIVLTKAEVQRMIVSAVQTALGGVAAAV